MRLITQLNRSPVFSVSVVMEGEQSNCRIVKLRMQVLGSNLT